MSTSLDSEAGSIWGDFRLRGQQHGDRGDALHGRERLTCKFCLRGGEGVSSLASLVKSYLPQICLAPASWTWLMSVSSGQACFLNSSPHKPSTHAAWHSSHWAYTLWSGRQLTRGCSLHGHSAR